MRARFLIGLCTGIAKGAAGQGAITGDSRLADAAMNRDKLAVRDLLKQKVDVNAPQADSTTALQWAAHWNDLESADLLIASGADPSREPLRSHGALGGLYLRGRADDRRETPESRRRRQRRFSAGETALMTAARAGNPDAVKVLVDHGAAVSAQETEHGQTALMWAVAAGRPAAVKVLLDRGAS